MIIIIIVIITIIIISGCGSSTDVTVYPCESSLA